ncbi:thymidine kinase [Actinokineospora cianjurensis]|uniref:Thymidine kinase n=1 Tax=Actinokineospora cianjurensis TaxID=585224 RepID=A0A421B456_9PSEU|nr:thymidine kinase [Actinokineospora cianjurensis]RLK59068.1 thymidine kinase [Actinokineospora cianjurensis]
MQPDSPDPQSDPTDALSAVPAAGARRATPVTGHLRFYYGPMDCGKSTLALQVDHNHARQGRVGVLLVRMDRSGRPQISSRIGITRPAVEVSAAADLRGLVRARWSAGQRVDYLIVDEAQFLTPAQVDQLAELADDYQVDVYCFGIATDFRGRLFPGASRLVELADELRPVQVDVLCWCGLPARFNARVVAGQVVREGDTVLVADTADTADTETGQSTTEGDEIVSGSGTVGATVRYQVLCRRHFRLGDLGTTSGVQGQLAFA